MLDRSLIREFAVDLRPGGWFPSTPGIDYRPLLTIVRSERAATRRPAA